MKEQLFIEVIGNWLVVVLVFRSHQIALIELEYLLFLGLLKKGGVINLNRAF